MVSVLEIEWLWRRTRVYYFTERILHLSLSIEDECCPCMQIAISTFDSRLRHRWHKGGRSFDAGSRRQVQRTVICVLNRSQELQTLYMSICRNVHANATGCKKYSHISLEITNTTGRPQPIAAGIRIGVEPFEASERVCIGQASLWCVRPSSSSLFHV
jgi:hypothetical protein